MTDQVTEVEETIVFPDEMAEMSFQTLVRLINERNAEVGKVNAVKGDRTALAEQIERESTDQDVIEAREAIQAAQDYLDECIMKMHSLVTPRVDALLEDAEASVKEIEESIKKHDETIRPGLAYFKKMYGENLSKHLPHLARLKGFTTKGAGSTGRRVRGYVVDVVRDGEQNGFENLATAAKFLDLETAQLQEKFFEAAGNPDKLKDAPDRVDFNVEYVETYEDGSSETRVAQIIATREHDEATA